MTIKLICPECRRENEAERIYCHDCGARLDRSAIAKMPPTEEQPQAAHKRLKSLFNPQRTKIRVAFFSFCKVVLGALAAAVLIELCMSPELPSVKKAVALPTQISMALENAALNHGWAPLQYGEDEVNTYVEYSAKTRKAAFNKFIQFERVVFQFKEERFRVTEQHSIFGLVFSVAGEYNVAIQNGKFVTSCKAGQIGHLPIHPKAMQLASFLFTDLLTAFNRERKSLEKMSAIEFHPQLVVIKPRA